MMTDTDTDTGVVIGINRRRCRCRYTYMCTHTHTQTHVDVHYLHIYRHLGVEDIETGRDMDKPLRESFLGGKNSACKYFTLRCSVWGQTHPVNAQWQEYVEEQLRDSVAGAKERKVDYKVTRWGGAGHQRLVTYSKPLLFSLTKKESHERGCTGVLCLLSAFSKGGSKRPGGNGCNDSGRR